MRFIVAGFFIALLACTPAQPSAESVPPASPTTNMNEQGTLFIGGTVVTGVAQTPQKNYAVYTTGGTIREVGPADALRRKYANARIVDASGATILPGLTDAHGHLYGLGLSLDTVSLVDTQSYEEVIARVRDRAAKTTRGAWIQGRGWDQNDWPEKAFPTAAALDAAVPDHPVWLRRIDGHAGLANSTAMRAAGVTAATKDPEGGRIERDANGNPTGVFVDGAMSLIDNAVPAPTPELRKARVLAAANAIAANGLTEMHDAGIDGATITAVQELIDEGKFPVRVYAMLGDNAELLTTWFKSGPLVDYGHHLTVRSVKLYADGALGSRGAALLEPYSDDPKNSGLMLAQPAHLEDVARRGRAAGFQINTHAIGDRGVRNVIDAYERAGVVAKDRNRVEHLQVIAPADVPRLVKHGIIASMQPTHATSDMYWAEARLGAERVKGAYAWRTVLNAGGRLALGSDFPVEQVNPFLGLHSAVTRQDQKNWPEGGWMPHERLTLAEAIRGFTSDAAYAAFEEKSRGTIEPGKLADLTIVEGDLYATPPSDLWKTKVKMTVVGGEIVFPRQ
ncbi:MAG TPA: amidohydrolase [Thermoanaerobaculia bacterium]|nr:amidohydrolase [Thermoanaerobaculia bacterium]